VQRVIIGVDVDEVLAQLHDPWDLWIREQYGVTPDWTDWHIDKTTGLGGEVFNFITPDIYTDGTVEPFPEALKALSMLREAGHTVWPHGVVHHLLHTRDGGCQAGLAQGLRDVGQRG
jgi:hypothetical protein